MVGTPHPALIGAPRRTNLIAVLPEGGAEAIASRRKSPDHDELLDHAAMEFGTD
jgi:argininosuccinate synthase